jgi:glutamine synthetase
MSTIPQSGNQGRLWAIAEVSNRTPRVTPSLAETKVSELFGSNTFNQRAMADKLPKDIYRELQKTIRQGTQLNRTIANEVAHAVKEWAIEKGATHFCHWFQPQTGLTAEKHDAFLTFDDEGQPIERFSGSQLIQSEPDASSFPSGGMRTTFEARGYTAWDPSSPIFLMDGPNGKTLCIPSVFISYHGHALDKKTPLLRSMEYLSEQALKVLRLFGNATATRVVPTLGPEQEYFLIDQAFYALRPDLQLAGRTLIGAKPPKGQELEDHYFGSIKGRILAFMQEAEFELYKLGVPVKTRHNEVAPSQYETAPIFEEVNVATDHNQLTMEVLRQVARRHNLALLLHEKPFAGINGSGKHNNWSLQDSEGNNLLDPGETPMENLQFLVFLVATLKGVNKRAGLLRAAIASAGNDHRLGANEAPPAIISAFLGEHLSEILDAIESGATKGETAEQKVINLGISQLPAVSQDNTDRNRTSPFAFTGNKFEFRAVASSASPSTPMATLNGAVGEALAELAMAIESRKAKLGDFNKAVMEVVREAIIETKKIRFEGNNYSEEWVIEAERRGVPNLRKTPEALAELRRPEAIEFFAKTGIASQEELEARYHIKTERYIKDIEIEIHALKDMVKTMVLPAAFKHQAALATAVKSLADISGSKTLAAEQVAEVETVAQLIVDLKTHLAKLDAEAAAAESDDIESKADALAYRVVPQLAAIREVCDKLEEVVEDSLWPLPKYREMLFLN